MTLIFIHGPAASGKLTIARELSALTGLPVYHNHIAVDAALSVFEFGSEAFVRLRHEMWIGMFREAAGAGRSIIFTFSPEPTVPAAFVGDAVDLVRSLGGEVIFVRLLCSPEEQERRIENPSRAEFRKLRSVEVLGRIREEGRGYPELPEPVATIDTTMVPPAEAALLIQRAIGL